jgi:hypothetical protein
MMRSTTFPSSWCFWISHVKTGYGLVVVAALGAASASGDEPSGEPTGARRTESRKILTQPEWQRIEKAVDNGLVFLKRQQRANGTFQSVEMNEPAITGLCTMAFLSRGHLPGQGPYGEALDKSVSFILNCQQSNGMISHRRDSRNSAYSHGICALALSELYGVSVLKDEARLRQVIERAIQFTSQRYVQPKRNAYDQGAWRYLEHHRNNDGDLSVTSWNVIFLRSAKNSGFEVDVKLIDEALAYTKSLYDPKRKAFRYTVRSEKETGEEYTRAMAGAGILSLSLSGNHHSEFAQNAATYLLSKPFTSYERPSRASEFQCYAAFYASQGMFQLGGEYWSEFYPQLAESVLKAQRDDGSWLLEPPCREMEFGASYMTALTLLALTPPYQMLPIFQR